MLAGLVAYWSISIDPKADSESDPKAKAARTQRTSRILAYWLGIVAFIITVVSTAFLGQFGTVPYDGKPGTLFTLLGAGILVGLFVMFAIDVLVRIRAVSIFVTLLAGTSLVGFYYYALTVDSRNALLIVVLGMLAGGLIYGAYVRPPDILNTLQIDNLGSITTVSVGGAIVVSVIAALIIK